MHTLDYLVKFCAGESQGLPIVVGNSQHLSQVFSSWNVTLVPCETQKSL